MESTAPLKLVQEYLQVLGIDPEATLIYISLAKNGPSSALQVSKSTSISRTQTYRRLEELQAAGLSSAEQLSYGTLFRALPFENVDALLAQREAETTTAKSSLHDMTEILQKMAGSAGPKATVQHYYGLAGLKQVNWNMTKADKEYRVFEAARLSHHLDKNFSRRHQERCMQNNLTSYDLTNDTAVYAKDMEPFDPTRTFLSHIDPKILTINFEVYIYNDVVTMLDYSDNQQLAMEIHHPTLHAMMKQLFEAMWGIATPLEIR